MCNADEKCLWDNKAKWCTDKFTGGTGNKVNAGNNKPKQEPMKQVKLVF